MTDQQRPIMLKVVYGDPGATECVRLIDDFNASFIADYKEALKDPNHNLHRTIAKSDAKHLYLEIMDFYKWRMEAGEACRRYYELGDSGGGGDGGSGANGPQGIPVVPVFE